MSQASDEDLPQLEGFYNVLEGRGKRNQEKLDNLPQDMGGRIKELMDYDFIDPEPNGNSRNSWTCLRAKWRRTSPSR